MVTRIFLAGVLGGIAMFIWSAIAHMFLPLGETGVREIPDEPAVVAAMKSGLKHPGFYIFPGLGAGGNPSRGQRSEAMKRMAETYPEHASGILIYHPPGRSLAFGRMLGRRIYHGSNYGDFGRLPSRPNSHTNFCWSRWLCLNRWNTCGDYNQYSVLELVWLPFQLYRRLHVRGDRWLPLCRTGCGFVV